MQHFLFVVQQVQHVMSRVLWQTLQWRSSGTSVTPTSPEGRVLWHTGPRDKQYIPICSNCVWLIYTCQPHPVPCETVFSKAGEIVSKKISCLSSSTVEKLLFLNTNLWTPTDQFCNQHLALFTQAHRLHIVFPAFKCVHPFPSCKSMFQNLSH